jgi:hypothetical protein
MSYSRQIADDNPEVPATERLDRAPAALRRWSRQMSYNESSYEQTGIIQAAVEMVVRLRKDGNIRRHEIIKVVLKIADEADHDANTLANLAISAMAEPERSAMAEPERRTA